PTTRPVVTTAGRAAPRPRPGIAGLHPGRGLGGARPGVGDAGHPRAAGRTRLLRPGKPSRDGATRTPAALLFAGGLHVLRGAARRTATRCPRPARASRRAGRGAAHG